MGLTSEQKAAVGRWVEEGAGLGEVQRRLQEEFGLAMTYMDVRLLVLDIGATVRDKEPPKPAEPPAAPADGGAGSADAGGLDAPAPGEAGGAPGKVSVTLDTVVRAGAMMSGSVTFSDGVTGGWMLDRMGRLALTKVSQPGYQPSDADLSAFQLELQNKLPAAY